MTTSPSLAMAVPRLRQRRLPSRNLRATLIGISWNKQISSDFDWHVWNIWNIWNWFSKRTYSKNKWEFTCWASKTQGMGHNPWNPLISTWLGLMDVHHPHENVWVLVHSYVNKKQPTIYTATQATTGYTQQHVYSRWQSTWLTSHIRNTSMIHRLIYFSIPRFFIV